MALEQLGPYKIHRLLGRGGMGAVYAGVDSETGNHAAIKVLSPALADDPGFRERFKAEIETLKKLRHPNIVQLYGYGEHDGHLFYAMELVEGRTLQEELQSGKRFDWREVGRIGIEICQGLKHAHDVGVIHRDLKPANLLVSKDGEIKLSDFGIAKLYGMTHLTADGGVLGTADYMAPEQAEGRQATTRCDMYSLGSVLFALLARRPPFAAATLPEVLHALRYDSPPPVRRFAPQVPAEFESILNELLDKDPQKRVATPLVLSNRLKAMLHALSDDKSIAARNAAGPNGDDEFMLRTEEPALPTSQRTTMGSDKLVDEAGSVTYSPPPTRAMSDAPVKAPQVVTPPLRHFTVVDNKASQRSETLPPTHDDSAPQWSMLVAAALIIAVIGGLGWYLTRPPSADALYAKISAAAREEDPALLSNIEPQIDQFLVDYATDSRYDEVYSYQQELAIYRLQRKLEFRARRLRGADSLLPVEQAYLDAINFERTSPETAAARLEALIDVFGSDDKSTLHTKNCVNLARRQLAMLRERISRSRDEHETVLEARLRTARELLPHDPDTSKSICQGLITLYADKPWAEESVRAARKLIAEIDAPPPISAEPTLESKAAPQSAP